MLWYNAFASMFGEDPIRVLGWQNYHDLCSVGGSASWVPGIKEKGPRCSYCRDCRQEPRVQYGVSM